MLKTYIYLFFSWVVVSAYSFEMNLTGSVEPLFYSTGDYTSYAYTSSVNIFPTKYIGAEVSYSQFHYQNDKIYYYDELKSNFVNLSAIVKSTMWKRQKFGIVAGLSVHQYEKEKNTVIFGAPDFDKISEFIDT